MSLRDRTALAVRIPVFVFGVALFAAFSGAGAFAQDANSMNGQSSKSDMEKPHNPKILVIYREDVKAGRAPSHEKVEAAFVQAYSKINGTRPYLAMTSVTGPTEAWFVEPADNFKELEAEMHATDNAPAAIKTQLEQIAQRESNEIAVGRQIVTVYREDLSYKPEFDIPHSRYVEVITFHVRPGKSNLLVEAAKLVRDAHEKAGDDDQWAMYQVASGGDMGTFYAFRPVNSLDKIDPTNTSADEAYHNALGSEGMDKLRQLTTDGFVSIESAIFAFDPKMSYPPKAFAAADSFWAPQGVQMASVGTSGKSSAVKKSSTVKKDKK